MRVDILNHFFFLNATKVCKDRADVPFTPYTDVCAWFTPFPTVWSYRITDVGTCHKVSALLLHCSNARKKNVRSLHT